MLSENFTDRYKCTVPTVTHCQSRYVAISCCGLDTASWSNQRARWIT